MLAERHLMRYVNLTIALLIAVCVLAFPFINPCTEGFLLCHTKIDGLTVIDYYGLTLYLP